MPAKPSKIVMWFRQDLRIADNPALMNACRKADQVLPIYILDDENCGRWRLGAGLRKSNFFLNFFSETEFFSGNATFDLISALACKFPIRKEATFFRAT